MGIEGPQNQENMSPKPVEGADVKNPDAVKAAHVESVSSGASWPTKEGLKDPEIKEAMMKYFDSMSARQASEFADQLYGIRMDLEEKNRPGALEKASKLLDHMGLPLAAVAGPAALANPILGLVTLGLAGLSLLGPKLTKGITNERNEAFKNAEGHLLEIQKSLASIEGFDIFHPRNE